MITTHDKWRALKEACVDTAAGALINIPINWALLSLAFATEMTALQATILITTVITCIAIARKMYIRLHFHKRMLNDQV